MRWSNSGRRRFVLPTRRRSLRHRLNRLRSHWMLPLFWLPETIRHRTRFESRQHSLRRSLGIPGSLSGRASRPNHRPRLSRQQLAVTRRLGVPRRHTRGSLGGTCRRRTRALGRLAIRGVLSSAPAIAMRSQALVYLLLPGRRGGFADSRIKLALW